MKALARVLGLFLLSMLVLNSSMAQKASFTTNGGLTLGFGAGMAYQKSDLANSKGLGFDFILGSQLYKKENAFLSVDWKFRFLAGENRAFDHKINPDNTYSNIRYGFFNYDLELGLTLNRLRERTRIVLTGFAGAGITHGRSFTDLYDAGNTLYDYSSIDPNRDRKVVYQDLVELSDGDFETDLVNKAALLPTAGLFLGYQLTRSLTIGLEFKTNFYLTERNSFAGIDLDNRVITGSGIDRNNYVSLGFRWSLRGGTYSGPSTMNYSSGVTGNYGNTVPNANRVVPATLPYPSVHITDPPVDSYHTASPSYTIQALVKGVSGAGNISFYQNDFPNNNFTYNVNTSTFIASVRLREGENNIRIIATNQGSSAEDLVLITLDKPREVVNLEPSVEFTSPWQRQITANSDRIELTASVKNIKRKEDIQLTLNGNNTPFEYSPASGLVETSVFLTEGENNFLIEGFNESGRAQDQLTVYLGYPEELALPAVRFINPTIPKEVARNRFLMSARTQNVAGRNDVTLRLNGALISNFSFNNLGEISANLLLSEGVNYIEVLVHNEAGFASESTTLTYLVPVFQEPVYQEPVYQEPVTREPVYQEPVTREPVVQDPGRRDPGRRDPGIINSPPQINILSPATHPFKTYEPSEELSATVLHINSKDNITLNINGSNTRNFNFSSGTKLLTARVALQEGENKVTIQAQNESGSAVKDQVFLKETKSCPSPVIRLIDPAEGQTVTTQASYALSAEVRNIQSSDQLKLIVNGKAVSFSYKNNLVSSSLTLVSGLNTLLLSASNECGEDKALSRISYKPSVVTIPCDPPKVSFTLKEVNRADASHELQGSVSGVKNKAGITLTLDGKAQNAFQFVPATGALSARFKLAPGSHTVVVSVNNDCGTDSERGNVAVEEPCTPPTVAFTLKEVNRADASHELQGSVSGVKNKAGITLTLDGKAQNAFQFVPATGALSARFKLAPGSHTVVVAANNDCGTDSKSASATVEEKACGIRINPGNSAWQFCLVTPSGTFTRENLTKANFSYSGSATSLFFMPIGGGGEATVKGSPYAIKSGQYYLFTGNLRVTVSTKNPGSMGHWSVCISADRNPVSGNGQKRPTSPCEENNDAKTKGNTKGQ